MRHNLKTAPKSNCRARSLKHLTQIDKLFNFILSQTKLGLVPTTYGILCVTLHLTCFSATKTPGFTVSLKFSAKIITFHNSIPKNTKTTY